MSLGGDTQVSCPEGEGVPINQPYVLVQLPLDVSCRGVRVPQVNTFEHVSGLDHQMSLGVSNLAGKKKTTKMVTSGKHSMAGELLLGLKAKSYDTCVSNLTKTHCVNLKKFNRDRLPEGMWITSERFLATTNCVMPNTLFELFGEFSNQTGSVVHDNMVGWAFDNYRLLEDVCKVAMTQWNISLHVWINEMVDECKGSDEIALYILSQMHRQYAFVYTHMFQGTTLLYTWPVQEKNLMDRCEIVLVFLKPGVFGKLHKICIPTGTVTSASISVPPTLPPVIPQNVEQQTQDMTTAPATSLVITADGSSVIPGNPEVIVNDLSEQTTMPTTLDHIDSMDNSTHALAKIDIFMKQHCSIPLVQCDFESALKAADTHRKETPTEHDEKGDSLPPKHNVLEQPEKTQLEVHTSGRACTVIYYKKFLDNYADEPPPPKEKM